MPRGVHRRKGGINTNRKGKFDPKDENQVKHTKIGKVWELYEERQPELAKIPFSARLNFERYLGLYDSLPFVWRMLKDIGSIRACWLYLGLYLAVQLALSLIPAVQLWYVVSIVAFELLLICCKGIRGNC